jgi:POU domain transcription factor, class 4
VSRSKAKRFKFLIFHLNLSFCLHLLQGDIFSGLNDGLLSRAEALAAVDMQKHQSSHAAHQQMTQQLKVNTLAICALASPASPKLSLLCRLLLPQHDVMSYHHGMGGPPQRPLQVRNFLLDNR